MATENTDSVVEECKNDRFVLMRKFEWLTERVLPEASRSPISSSWGPVAEREQKSTGIMKKIDRPSYYTKRISNKYRKKK